MPRPHRQPTKAQPSATSRLASPAALALLVIVVYAGVRDHQFLNFDDPIYLTANPHVLAGLTGASIRWAFTDTATGGAWHPVTWLTHIVAVQLFGVSASAHLLINVLFHFVNTLLLFFVLRKLTGAGIRSAIVAALFAVHPLHVESVAWLAERKDMVSGLLAMLTVWMYADYARSCSKARYALALVFFALGLMSKGMLVTLPFVLLLLDFWPLQRRALMDKLPFFALIIPSIAITIAGQQAAHAVATTHSLGARIANAVLSYGAYLWKTIWPASLAIPYPWRTPIEPLQVAAAGIVVAAISVAAFVFRRERPALFTGWFWFVGMLVPVIGIVQIGSQAMADRYTYLPHIGLFIAVVWLISDALSPASRRLAAVVSTVVIAVFAFVANRQSEYWSDSVSLFTHAIEVTKNNSVAHLNLGSALQDAGDPNGALREVQAAVEADPTAPAVLVKLARLELQFGRTAEAATHLQTAAALDGSPETLALLALARGDNAGAIVAYAKAVAADPASAVLRNDYGAVLARAGRNEEALAQYREAIRLAPDQYDTYMNQGAVLARLGKIAEARDQFSAAASIRPGSPEPYVYLALLNTDAGRIDLALMSAQTAMAIDPVQANLQFTNLVRMPFKETNLQEFVAMLQSRR